MEYGKFPAYRPRRMRDGELARQMIRETELSAKDFIYPLFVKPGQGRRDEIPSMPNVYQVSLDMLMPETRELLDCGIHYVLLFGLPASKDEVGSSAWDEHGVVQEAVRIIRANAPQMYVITDVCMCEYTSHGHCGKLDQDGYVMNDETLDLLAREAVSHAQAGANMVAPSDMMDGRIGHIRRALDQAGFSNVPIMSYSTKYASGFYGPFRDAADSAPAFGDRRAYQMDPANADEGVREAMYDIAEGADLVMVKAAAANGWVDERRVVLELLTSIKRAGADMIITYHAKDAARWLAEG